MIFVWTARGQSVIDMDSKTLHIIDYDKLHIYMVAQILGVSEDTAQLLYDRFFDYDGCDDFRSNED